MSKEETVRLAIPIKEYEEYAKWAKELGYESVDAFVEKSTRAYLEHLKRKVAEKTSREEPKCPMCQYQLTEVMAENEGDPMGYSCEKHGPMVEVTLMFPKRVIEFLTDVQDGVGMTVKEYLYHSIMKAIAADLDQGEVFVPTPKHYVEKYDLKHIFKASNALLLDW